MNVFVFQSGFDHPDLQWTIRPGMRDTWYATRHQQAMRPRDIVFFGMAKIEFALYGWGRITSAPYLRSDWDAHGVDVMYEVKFSRPIPATSLRNDPILAGMLIFRAPRASNFLLLPNQAKQ